MHDRLVDAPRPAGLRQRRPSGTTSSSAVKTIEERLLLLWDDLPHWRRDNAYITSGYRHMKPSYLHSVLSLTHLHNESVNIWSHLLGAVTALAASLYLYLLIHPRYDSASANDVIVFGCFFGGAFLCLGMSATFHALLSHSEHAARWGNKLDYTGIVLLIVGSYVPALYYGFFCKPQLLTFYLCLVSFLPRPVCTGLCRGDRRALLEG
jgi:adiponectin receptor